MILRLTFEIIQISAMMLLDEKWICFMKKWYSINIIIFCQYWMKTRNMWSLMSHFSFLKIMRCFKAFKDEDLFDKIFENTFEYRSWYFLLSLLTFDWEIDELIREIILKKLMILLQYNAWIFLNFKHILNYIIYL